MSLKFGIYDWNGTLLADFEIAYRAMCAIFRKHGLKPPTREDYKENITPDIITFYHERLVPRTVTKADMDVTFKSVVEEYWDDVDLSPHTYGTLHELREHGVRSAIVSAELNEVLNKRMDQFGLKNKIDKVIGESFRLGKVKNIRFILKEFGVKPEDAFYVGDTCGDIQAAKEVGVKAIAFTGGFNTEKKLRAAGPDEIIDSLWHLTYIASES